MFIHQTMVMDMEETTPRPQTIQLDPQMSQAVAEFHAEICPPGLSEWEQDHCGAEHFLFPPEMIVFCVPSLTRAVSSSLCCVSRAERVRRNVHVDFFSFCQTL